MLHGCCDVVPAQTSSIHITSICRPPHFRGQDQLSPQLWPLGQPASCAWASVVSDATWKGGGAGLTYDGLGRSLLVDICSVNEVPPCLYKLVEDGLCLSLVTLAWAGPLEGNSALEPALPCPALPVLSVSPPSLQTSWCPGRLQTPSNHCCPRIGREETFLLNMELQSHAHYYSSMVYM